MHGGGWQTCWRIETNGRPRLCAQWNASYVDASTAQDRAGATGLQQLPAAFAVADLQFTRSEATTTSPPLHWTGALDHDGCVPIDVTPSKKDLELGTGVNLTLRLQYATQHCYDPDGADCKDDVGNPKGARFIERLNSSAGPDTICVELTTDETLVDPNCKVVKASQGAFSAWSGQLPSSPILFNDGSHTPTTRIAATVSELLQQEVDTNGDMGIALGMIHNSPSLGEATFLADTTCELIDETTQNVIERDTCQDTTDNNYIKIRPDVLCSSARVDDCIDLATGAYTPCNPETDANCFPGDSRWKYTLMHEFGHYLQLAAMGQLRPSYQFDGNPDLPGAPDLCTCKNVSSANAQHCLQSLEQPEAAQLEGWAQFYTSKVWNNPGEDNCDFEYYKEFTSADGVVHPPPVSRDCKNPVRWRNSHCTGSPDFSGLALADMGTEYDWLTFLWNVNTVGSDRLSMADLSNMYLVTCGGSVATARKCNNQVDTASWEGSSTRNSLRQGATGLFTISGHEQPNKLAYLILMSDQHGISRNTDPLP